MLIWTAQKLQNTKHNSGSAFPEIITGFGFQNAVDGCVPEPNASSDSHESQSSAQATTAQHLFIHNRPRLWNRNLGLRPPHLPPPPAAALVTDAAAPKQSIRAPQKAAMLEAAA